jgi:hypothetical protein
MWIVLRWLFVETAAKAKAYTKIVTKAPMKAMLMMTDLAQSVVNVIAGISDPVMAVSQKSCR